MPEDDWLESEPLRQLIHWLTDDIAARYRVSWPDAEQTVYGAFASNRQLQAAATADMSAEKLKRTRVFKQAASDVKRKIYYQLRAYRVDDERLADLLDCLQRLSPNDPLSEKTQAIDGILESHVSTRERLAQREEFYRQLAASVRPPKYVLDVGCGVHPLMFPYQHEWASQIVQYLALDNNARDVACIAAYDKLQADAGRIASLRWDISEGWESVLQQATCREFDLALMMKLVPVVQRQHRELIPMLYETPAAEWLLTGSRFSMTKNISIERREKRALQEFVRQAGRQVQQEFTIAEEFAWLVA